MHGPSTVLVIYAGAVLHKSELGKVLMYDNFA